MDQVTLQNLQDGFRKQQEGDFEQAARLYDAVLRSEPGNEFALNLRGVICIRRGEFPAAIAYLRRATAVNDRDAETQNNLGLAYQGLHDFPTARQAFAKSLAIEPRQPSVLNNLGNVEASLNRHAEAILCFESALRLDPDYVDCRGNLCLSLLAERRFGPALQVIERAIVLAPRNARAHAIKGRVLSAMLRYGEAAGCFESAISLDATLAEAWIQLSTALKQLRREHAARAALDRALELEPWNSEAHKCLGVLLEQTGDFAGAARHFREAIQHSPGHASAYYQLSKLNGERLTEAELHQVRRLLDDAATHAQQRGPLLFALASELEKRSDYAGSLTCLIEGNRLRSRQFTYDPQQDDAYFAAVAATFPLQVAAGGGAGPGRFVPIFVLGMPRSGTTLTEQILASHSRIAGTGESGALSDLAVTASALKQSPFPQCCGKFSQEDISALRARYFSAIGALAEPAEFVVDKTPMNYHLVGLIMTLFPEARIIYCKRDALDNCLSIFKLPFDENQSYSHDLASLGRYYRNHERLMAFWRSCYPRSILTVDYELTVGDVELQARRMLEFVGVAYEDAVIRFHENDRMVLTPSAQQVRRPIYHSGVGAWRNYAAGLEPLMTALG